ncbi:CehA/McbA family metallohydrolase [Aquisphaera insulae]|uniref:CehA/McbA family metallohydrolase n=1 Tax=Aquisphaera insulae TaxID=2712864 RepID=UPI0013EC0F75|nr:CehA/McbA family metallohydrolase [Aquisphaera insulae]
MRRIVLAIVSSFILLAALPLALAVRTIERDDLAVYRQAGLVGGDPARGKAVFQSTEVGCAKCHVVEGDERRAGPSLQVVGDKYSREQLIQSVLEPSATVHPDYGTIVASTKDGRVFTGVLLRRTETELRLLDAESKLVTLPIGDVEAEKRSEASLMPVGLEKTLKVGAFADLIAYLASLKQSEGTPGFDGMPIEIPPVERPIRLAPLFGEGMRFDHPVWVVAVPGGGRAFLVVEQKSRKIWRVEEGNPGDRKELFVDLSGEATTGDFEGVVCLAFHPNFVENRKYYVNYHVRNQGSFFSPVIVERQATPDLRRDAGVSSRRILQIHQDTDIHWGGMLAFGPDGFLYIGAGDAGPQEDPDGHGQNPRLLTGSILRIDVDRRQDGREYAIPETNPFRNAGPSVRPEIWAKGFRMPWRFSFDTLTGDLWVGDVGQNLFEEVTIARAGENHGWNVHEGFMTFSDRYRRPGVAYTPPVLAYRRKYGPSVTGGYVYRGTRNASYQGAYIFGDFESKRIWAMTQAGRRLTRIRQIVESPQRIVSFGVDHGGELLLVGYEGTVFRLVLGDSDFGPRPTRVSLLRDGAPAAARVRIVGSDGRPYGPAGAPLRKTTRGDSYFYADGSFEVDLPPGPARMRVDGGIESVPQELNLDPASPDAQAVRLGRWADLAARGWYSGDSHVHLHTGGPIGVTPADALVAARAEGVSFVNLCASNSAGDDVRDAELITGKPHAVSTDRHLVAFGEELRSTIYGHMQFFGIGRLVEPQYTGFDGTPNRNDFPANFAAASEAVRQGGVVTYGHPMFSGQSSPFGKDPSEPSGAARELPIDAVLGVVHAVDLMSYNSDEDRSTELWYRLLNCGLRLSACVGTDALLDRSTDPLGGDRVYVKADGPLTMRGWLEGLKAGRSFVTNGPMPMLEVDGKGPGEAIALEAAGKVRVIATVESRVPFDRIEVIVNGEVAARKDFNAGDAGGVRSGRLEAELPFERSGWVALRVRGPDHPDLFDGPAWAHTSPVYVAVAGKKIASRRDAEFFVGWIDQMLRAVAARNRFATADDRRQVEVRFREAQERFRAMAVTP